MLKKIITLMKKSFIIILSASLLAVNSAFAGQIKSSSLSNDSAYQSQEQIEYMQKEIQNLNSKIESLEHSINLLRRQIETSSKLEESSTPKVETPQVTDEQPVAKKPAKGSEKQIYDLALSALKGNDFKGAVTKFDEFFAEYPKSQLIGNAYYWYGEAFFKQKSYDKAAIQFLRSYKEAPKGAKASESLLKLAISLGEIGKKKQACSILDKLDKEFKNRSEASVKKSTSLRTQFKC